MGKAVIIFSGGQDSTTCLGIFRKEYELYPITFFYGQKHGHEIGASRIILLQVDKVLYIRHKVIDLSFLPELVTSALTNDGEVSRAHPDRPELPASFVPNRNGLFITLAHAYAQKIGAQIIIGGMCQTDYSGYPDCRKEFIDRIVDSLNFGSNSCIPMLTPLMYLTKAETFRLAEITGVLNIVLKYSRTCYNNSNKMNAWGYGCDNCPACSLRKKGWEEYKGEVNGKVF